LILAFNEHHGNDHVKAETDKFKRSVDALHEFDAALAKIEADKQPDLPFEDVCGENCKGDCGCDSPCDICAASQV
jgi:hypothetical protein